MVNTADTRAKEYMSKYFHPRSWKDDSALQKLREFEPALDIKPESCICRNCWLDVSCIGESGFIPRWRKMNEIEQQCYVSQCKECVCKITTLSDQSTICSSFGMDKEN